MKYEKLNVSNSKKVFLCGIIVGVVLIIIINFFMSYAKYKTVDSVKLASGTISYSSADLNVVAMYTNDGEDGVDTLIEKIPDEGYILDSTRSYCIVGNNNDDQIKDVFEYKSNKIYIGIDQKDTKCYIYFKLKPKTPSEQTLANLFKGFTTSDNGTNLTTENGELVITGVDKEDHPKTLYKAQDNDGISYFFRGQASDNWLKFAGYYWHIIRINGDGTLRILYAGTNTPTSDDVIQSVEFNVNDDDNTYVGYYVGSNGRTDFASTHSSSSPGTVASALNTWYSNNIGNNEEFAKWVDSNAGFCNDRSVASSSQTWYNSDTKLGYGNRVTAYGPFGRSRNTKGSAANPIKPTLICGSSADITNEAYKRDYLTPKNSTKGNAVLAQPVGLITMDEVACAGGTGSNNQSFYLYTGGYSWTMSPYLFTGSSAQLFSIDWGGALVSKTAGDTAWVRPVINLKSNISFEIGGDGTSGNPFVVVTD